MTPALPLRACDSFDHLYSLNLFHLPFILRILYPLFNLPVSLWVPLHWWLELVYLGFSMVWSGHLWQAYGVMFSIVFITII